MILEIEARKPLLALPVFAADMKKENLHTLRISMRNRQIYEFKIPFSDKTEPDYFAYLPIGEFAGKTLQIELIVCKPEGLLEETKARLPDRNRDMGEEYFPLIHQSDAEELPKDKRPKFQYTAPYGWLNDPNGMVYHDGIYHLYYQHNPMNTEWENMSWGHSVSKDLVHFEYVSDVMFPDENGTMFSGCAIVNERGCFGLPKDAILFFYTAAGSANAWSKGEKFTQRLAYSLDGGKTLIKHERFCLDCIEDGNRDPKVFWHEKSGAYIMSLFLSEHRFAILRSKDLEHWEISDRFSHSPMWECPDLFLLKAEDGEEKWAFMSADGYYFIGEFDGFTFTPQTSMMQLYGNALPYAAQSFSNTGDRVISIAWLRTADKEKKYSGMLGIARQFDLGKDSQGYYIRQRFVQEINANIQYENDKYIIKDDGIMECISADGRVYEVVILE